MFEDLEINELELCPEPIPGLSECENDDELTAWELFSMEIDTWARRASAANGFGDY
jgi:hypothetical protein